MSCPQCEGIERQFDSRWARREARKFGKKGPLKSTRFLLDAIKARGVREKSLLDVGGGVGTVQHALAEAGVGRITSVDAASNYLEISRQEAEKRGYADIVTYRHANFVEIAKEIEQADIVTLDRVICCYDDMPALVSSSTSRARDLYGLTYPRETWWLEATRLGINAISRIRRRPFRFYVHPEDQVRSQIRNAGFVELFSRRTAVWNVELYRRSLPA